MADVGKYKTALANQRRQNRELTEALEKSLARNTELETNLNENTEQLQGLYGTVQEGTTRAAYEKAWKAQGVNERHYDDLWSMTKPDKFDDDPEPKAISKLVAKSLETRQWAVEPDEDPDAEEEQTEEEDRSNNPRNIFDVAKPVKGKADEKAKPGDQLGGAKGKPEANGKAKSATAPKLSNSEGSGRGRRDDHTNPDGIAAEVDRDFAATGRTDPFKI